MLFLILIGRLKQTKDIITHVKSTKKGAY